MINLAQVLRNIFSLPTTIARGSHNLIKHKKYQGLRKRQLLKQVPTGNWLVSPWRKSFTTSSKSFLLHTTSNPFLICDLQRITTNDVPPYGLCFLAQMTTWGSFLLIINFFMISRKIISYCLQWLAKWSSALPIIFIFVHIFSYQTKCRRSPLIHHIRAINKLYRSQSKESWGPNTYRHGWSGQESARLPWGLERERYCLPSGPLWSERAVH